MNILVVSDIFISGGLEQHILTLAEEGERRGEKFFFAFGRYEICGNSIIDQNVVFRLRSPLEGNAAALEADVNGLVSTIRKLSIDVVHVHPFKCYLPCVIAAEHAGIPLVYTSHGTASYSFPDDPAKAMLFQHCLSTAFSAVLSVNKKCTHYLRSYFPQTKIVDFCNPIAGSALPSVSDSSNTRDWLLVSRLDADKAPGIRCFLRWLPSLPISKLVVFGSGNCEDELQRYCDELGVSSIVEWRGSNQNWIVQARNFVGVVGLGRVALEAASAGRLVVLLSPDQAPCGVLDLNRCIQSESCNFNGASLLKLKSADDLAKEMKEALNDSGKRIREVQAWVSQRYSVNRVYEVYKGELAGLRRRNCSELSSYFSALLLEPEALYDLRIHFDILKRTIVPFAANPIEMISFMEARIFSEQISEKLSAARGLNALENRIANLDAVSVQDGAFAGEYQKGSGLKISALMNEVGACSDKLNSIEAELQAMDDMIQSFKTSYSWKIGRIITAIPRFIIRLIKKSE